MSAGATEPPAGAAPVRVGVLAGSPRRASCARLARDVVAPALRGGGVEADVRLLADYDVAGCTGCGACSRTGTCVLFAREAGEAAGSPAPGPAFSQVQTQTAGPRPRGGGSFLDLFAWLDGLDALFLVAPIYFAGPPAQLKALLDRLQFLWARRYVLKAWPALPLEGRRPLLVLGVGGGGDPFGSEALVTCARSALRMMDFELERSETLVGYRTGRAGVLDDAGLERRAAELACELVAIARARGPFARRGQVNPLASCP